MDLPVNYNDLHFTDRKRVREEYVQMQDGKCHFCKTPLNGEPSEEIMRELVNKKLFPKNFFKFPVHLHLSLETGMTIGAVLNYCNAVLWQYYGE